MCGNRFFICKHCGNLINVIHSSGAPISCCGEHMSELVPGSMDASQEKHVPAVKVSANAITVEVGSAPHPMLAEHFIEWVQLATETGVQRKCLKPGEAPTATFILGEGEKAVTAYAYCNLHGLWKADI